jgi:hypothetical protein
VRLASVYGGNSPVAAMLLAAPRRGHADRYSDSEIGVFWPQPPSDEERAAVIAPAGVDLIRRYPDDCVGYLRRPCPKASLTRIGYL